MSLGDFDDTFGPGSLLSEPREEAWHSPKLDVPWLQIDAIVSVNNNPVRRTFFIRAPGLDDARVILFQHHPELGDLFSTPIQQRYLEDADREVLNRTYPGVLVAEYKP